MNSLLWTRLVVGAVACVTGGVALASSHREAPFITTRPKVDGTDFYMFSSYETGRTGFTSGPTFPRSSRSRRSWSNALLKARR